MDHIVLIVDDDLTSLKRASSIIEKDYRVASATSGAMALKYLEKNTPDLILLDLNMPDMDGFEVMKRINANPEYSKIPVIFLSAAQTPQEEAECLAAGAIDFVGKPFIPQVLKTRVKRVIELYDYKNQLEGTLHEKEKELLERSERINDIQEAVIVGMANLIEERDNSTGYHVKNTQKYVKLICKALAERGMYPNILTESYMNNLIKSAPLHDVGKIKISDAILQKTGKLSEEEYKIIKNHSRYGADIIEDILGEIEDTEYMEVARDVVLYHHERWDGNGYPEGLKGEEIPLGARIMAIADVFDAISADRVYHRGIRKVDEVFSIMQETSGTQFDPTILEVFMSLRDELAAQLEEEDNL